VIQSESIKRIDEEANSGIHWRMILTAGMGFFTDAYDLFIIGVVTAILSQVWHISILQIAVLNACALAAAAVGAIFFGMLSDRFGRKKFYGLEVVILFVGAILSAISMNYMALLLSRILVGFGIGGDYPSSAVMASEHSPYKRRGFLVLLVFAMQAVGLIVGPFLASILLSTHIPQDYVWRILLGLGAIPAASVFYLRRRISETPHYVLNRETHVEVSRVIHDMVTENGQEEKPSVQPTKHKLFSGKWLQYLIGTSSAWFLLDVAFYGNGVSSVLIMHTLSPHASLLEHTLVAALLFLVFAVPGYFLSAKYIDQIGRKSLQMLGFTMIGLCYCLIAFVRRNPYSIILLDEMEKAHPGVHDIFYQIFDKGIVKDGQGRDINFKNTLIIMTSNACSDLIESLYLNQKNTPPLEELLSQLIPELNHYFKPAFLGRTTVIPYLPLQDDSLRQIASTQLGKIQERVKQAHNIQLNFGKETLNQILAQCHHSQLGARQIESIITENILPNISNKLLNNMVSDEKVSELTINFLSA